MAKEYGTGRALVVAFFGKALALVWDGDEALTETLDAAGASRLDGFDFEDAGVDAGELADGVYVGRLVLSDDGPGDWPGSREVAVSFRDKRPATAEEWASARADEWPWDPRPDAITPA